jgi:hypothetical protein
MPSNATTQRTTTTAAAATTTTPTTITAHAEIAAFSSDTGCPTRVSTEPVDPRYAHSAALGRRQQDTSHRRARRCQECTRPLPTASTSRYCTVCDPSGPSTGDLWSDQDTAVEAHAAPSATTGLQQEQPQQTKKGVALQQVRVYAWEDETNEQEDTARVGPALEGDDDDVPDEWDAEDD